MLRCPNLKVVIWPGLQVWAVVHLQLKDHYHVYLKDYNTRTVPWGFALE